MEYVQIQFVACSNVIHHSKVEFCSFGKAFVQFYTYFISEKMSAEECYYCGIFFKI